MNLQHKIEKLNAIFSDAGSVVIALSGGTDSTFLVSLASEIKGLKMMAITVSTPYMFRDENDYAARFCRQHNIPHREIVTVMPAQITSNPSDRCYLCKKEIMKLIMAAACETGYEHVFDGTNADDLTDHRPGLKALKELGIRSPLAEAGLTKTEIRKLAHLSIPEISNKPSNTCLLTRFPYNTLITTDELLRAEEAERIVTGEGFPGARVRIHGDLVRIECRKGQLSKILKTQTRQKIVSMLKKLEFRYITIDAENYRSGSMGKED